jgi:hypothetical protein
MAEADDGSNPPTLEELQILTGNATRNLTDDPIGAFPRQRREAAGEPWRLRNVPVKGERTAEQAAALRGRKAMLAGAANVSGVQTDPHHSWPVRFRSLSSL